MALTYEKRDRIAYMTFNRPEVLNAIDIETFHEFCDACVDFRDDPDVWLAIVSGTGDKAFAAGADLKDLGPGLISGKWREPASIMRGLEVWKPFIAAINGMAFGGGLEVALACDLRIAAENARFGFPEVSWGVIPNWGGIVRLSRMIPSAKAAEVLIAGQTIDAKEAYRIGLVNEVVSLPELLPSAKKLADKILTLGPLAIRTVKKIMLRTKELPLESALQLERDIGWPLFSTDDAQEGLKAFAEKRKPQFKAT